VTNREIAEDAFAAFQRGDLAAAFRRTVPDVEFDNRAGGADVSGVWRGINGLTYAVHDGLITRIKTGLEPSAG
jgi:hypothetical protein